MPRRSSISRSSCRRRLRGRRAAPRLRARPADGDRATRTPATRPRRRARKERDSEPMPPLAEIVFLTPQAALVGLVFAAPLVMLAIRERAYSARPRDARPASTRRLRGSSYGRSGSLPWRPLWRPRPLSRRSGRPTRRGCARTRRCSSRSTSAARCWRRARPVGSYGWSARARSAGTSTRRSDDLPTGVATLTNRMMPLLFPTGDARGVTAVIDHSLQIMQPRPERLTAARASSLAALSLAADRSYFNPSARKRVLVVFSDLDTDLLQPGGNAAAAAEAPDRAVRRPCRGARANGSSTPTAARSPMSRRAR